MSNHTLTRSAYETASLGVRDPLLSVTTTPRVRVLLVNLESNEYPLKTAPLALITLGAHLKNIFPNFVSVQYVDLQLQALESMGREIDDFQPHILGLSVPVGGVPMMRQILRKDWPGQPLVILGNAVPTYAAKLILEEFPHVVCAIGRGEVALAAVTRQVALSPNCPDLCSVPNIIFRQEEHLVQTEVRGFDLRHLGPADWLGLSTRYPLHCYQEVWLEASQGCPHKKGGVGCSFCAIAPNGHSRDWTPRDSTSVIRELELLASYNISHVRFADEEFMAGQTDAALSFATELLGEKTEARSRGLTIPTFDFAIRVDDVFRRGRELTVIASQADNTPGKSSSGNNTRRKALETFKLAGLTQVYLGIESGSEAQLKRFYKGVRPMDNARALSIVRELEIRAAVGWILLDPLMADLSDLDANISFLRSNELIPSGLKSDFVTNPINRMRVLEGSPYVDLLRKEGLLDSRHDNLVEWRFRYIHPTVGAIARILGRWESETFPLVYAVKAAVGAKVSEGDGSTSLQRLGQYLVAFKRADFGLLTALVAAAKAHCCNDATLRILDSARDKRASLIRALTHEIRRGTVLDTSGSIRDGLARISKSKESCAGSLALTYHESVRTPSD